jgi:hypothetical protein
MSDAIAVRCDAVSDGYRCDVVVGEDAGATTHEVRVSREVLRRLLADAPSAPQDAASAEALVRASFEFLLEREPRGSILRTFDLDVIERYFPGYERAIGARVAMHLKGERPDADRA